MSLYRQAGGRGIGPLAAAAVVLVLIGGLAGYLIGHGGDDEPSLQDAVASVGDQVQPALRELEVIPIEYPQGIKDGAVAEPTEFQATLDHLTRAQGALDDAAPDLKLLSPADEAAARGAMEKLAGAINAHAAPQEVDADAQAATAAISKAARL
jgi:hypothetical protein